MSMNVASPDSDEAELNTTINTTPLVDVMLVMLIIFLITVPVIRKVVPVELPNARNIATVMKPQPEVHIRGDKDARFQDVGRLVYDCQRSGIQKVGFLTEPRNDTAQ